MPLDPPRFDEEADFELWLAQFERYLRVSKTADDAQLDTLLLCAGNKAARYYDQMTWPPITDAERAMGVTEYSRAVSFLRLKFQPDRNELTQRLQFYGSRQANGQTLSDFVCALRQLAKHCSFPAAFHDEALRDAFCHGLLHDSTKKAVCRAFATAKKISGGTFSLQDAISAAEIEEAAMKSACESRSSESPTGAEGAVANLPSLSTGKTGEPRIAATGAQRIWKQSRSSGPTWRCRWCNKAQYHVRANCPALGSKCRFCGVTGHWEIACEKKLPKKKTVASQPATAPSTIGTIVDSDDEYRSGALPQAQVGGKQGRRFVEGSVNGYAQRWLVDSGSDITVIKEPIAKKMRLHINYARERIRNVGDNPVVLVGKSIATIELNSCYVVEEVFVARELCDDAILGMSALSQFESLTINFGGCLPALKISANPGPRSPVHPTTGGSSAVEKEFLEVFDCPTAMKVKPLPVITLENTAKPVRCKSRFRTRDDNLFIRSEVRRMKEEGIIQPSRSSWRSQIVVATGASGKKRLAIDYASTVNRFTQPDAFPVPLVRDVLQEVSAHKIFSSIDLRGAYHQLLLRPEERHLTAFEGDGKLYEFTRLPFGVMNGVPAFTRALQEVTDGLKGVTTYLDDIVIGGSTPEEHDDNLRAFLLRARECGLSLSSQKCRFRQRKLVFLGHVFEDGEMRPDPERLQPLLDFPTPTTGLELERLLGLLVYYSKWVDDFSTLADPLFEAKKKGRFQLGKKELDAISTIKKAIAEATLAIPEPGVPMVLETDASGQALGGVLSQGGRPVAFVSHKLSEREKRWSPVELEAYAIVRCTEQLRPFLLGQKFTLITDQKGVAYLLDARPKNAVKNAKLSRWRVELAEFNFEIVYRPGELNQAADALSRVAAMPRSSVDGLTDDYVDHLIEAVHRELGHPGVQRTVSYIRSTVTDAPTGLENKVRRYINGCEICAQLKPKFFKPARSPLIRSLRPWERLSIDFVGPKPSSNNKRYLLTVVDEYSRYPFAFPLSDMTASKAIRCLESLFTMFGPPQRIHSD